MPVLAQNASVVREQHSAEELKNDFAVFRAALEEGHPALYRYISKKEMDAVFDVAAASISKEMTDRQFMILLCKVAAHVGDGHLRVVPPKIQLDKLDDGPTAIPFQPYWSADKLYVWRNYSSVDDKEFLGAEILSINGHSTADLIREYRLIFPSDGKNTTHTYWSLQASRWFTRYFYILYGYTESYQVSYLPTGESAQKTATLPGLIFDKLLEIREKRYPAVAKQAPTEFTISPEQRSAYLRITTFDKERLGNGKVNFPKFLEKTFTDLDQNQVKNLILDLRSNGGGTDEYGRLLFSYFTSKDFDYYDSLRMNKESFDFFKYTSQPGMRAPSGMLKANGEGTFDNVQHPNIGRQKPSSPTFTGNIYVLINGGCFSTTSEFLSLLHFQTNAIFIGEESGGGYYGNSSGPTPDMTLPNSRVRVEIPLMKYSMAVRGYKFDDRGLMPNYPIIPTISDRLKNKDVELDLAQELIKKQDQKKQ